MRAETFRAGSGDAKKAGLEVGGPTRGHEHKKGLTAIKVAVRPDSCSMPIAGRTGLANTATATTVVSGCGANVVACGPDALNGNQP